MWELPGGESGALIPQDGATLRPGQRCTCIRLAGGAATCTPCILSVQMSVLIMRLRPLSIASYQSEDRNEHEKRRTTEIKQNRSDFFTLAHLPLANTQGEELIITTVFFKPDIRSGFRFYRWWAVGASKAFSAGLIMIRTTESRLNIFYIILSGILSSLRSFSLGCAAYKSVRCMLERLSNQISDIMRCQGQRNLPGGLQSPQSVVK